MKKITFALIIASMTFAFSGLQAGCGGSSCGGEAKEEHKCPETCKKDCCKTSCDKE